MEREEMIKYVDEICERCGYENAPAYDFVLGKIYMMNDNDAREKIVDLLKDYNS